MDSKTTSTASTVKSTSTKKSYNATEYGMSKFKLKEDSEFTLAPNDDRRPVIPGERSSGRVAKVNYGGKGPWGKINTGMDGLKEIAAGKSMGKAVKPQSSRSKPLEAPPRPRDLSSSRPPISHNRSRSLKEKVGEDVAAPAPSSKRSRVSDSLNAGTLSKKRAIGRLNQQERTVASMVGNQPDGPAAPPKVKRTLGNLFPKLVARTPQAETRQVLDDLATVNKHEHAESPDAVPDALHEETTSNILDQASNTALSPSCIAVAHSYSTSPPQQERLEATLTRMKDFVYNPSVASTTADTPTTPSEPAPGERSDISSPLSEVPSDFDKDLEQEPAIRDEQLSRYGTKEAVKPPETPNDGAVSRPTAIGDGSARNISQTEIPIPVELSASALVPVPSLALAQIKSTTSRPRRSVQPIKRLADEIGGKSSTAGTEHTEAMEAVEVTSTMPKCRGTKRGRRVSAKDHESDDSDSQVPNPDKKQRIVKLSISPNKLMGSTSISKKPQRKPATARKLQHSLPTPESSLESDGDPTPETEELDVSSELHELSRKLSAREPLHSKPAPAGQPTVWADSRQALCETVPYFKMPQSGCHQRDGHVYAFLYDGVGHPREYMDTDLIIARAGGSMEQDANGQLQQKKDHSMDEAQVQAVLNDIEHQNPVVIICGNKHAGAMCKMPHRYCVLGWYKPVAVWAEKTLGKGKKAWTTIKYRLERLDSSKSVWYAPTQAAITDQDRELAGSLIEKDCRDCNTRWPQVYLNGWMCLNSSCERFWKLYCGEDAPYGKLHYNPAFLLDRTQWTNEQEPYDVRPPIPDSGKVIGDNLSKINTRGIVCPKCGRCNHRRLWRGWSCENVACDFEAFPIHVPVKPALLHQPWDSVGDGPTLSQNKYAKHLNVKVKVSHKLGFKVFTYTFDGIDGKLVHAVSNARINRAPGGPDDMFEAMQRQDDPEMNLHLERRPFIGTGSSASLKLKLAAKSTPETEVVAMSQTLQEAAVADLLNTSHGLFGDATEVKDDGDEYADVPYCAPKRPGKPAASAVAAPAEDGDFMTSFSMNYGMPYKFVAGGASLPFATAPWPVRACRADLNWASKNFSDPAGHVEFNEQLIFAYMEGQKVEYHDDGETGLGARIASMSFGSKAKMMLRMKTKHYVGCSKTGVLTQDKPVPGSIGGEPMYRKRLAAWQELEELKLINKQAYEKRRKELPKELGIFEKRTKKAEDLVTITLNHGDIVLMEGYEIQQYLEHKVVPEGCLRFALTCRTVLPEHLKPEERPSYGVEADEPDMSSLVRLAKAEAEASLEVVSEASA